MTSKIGVYPCADGVAVRCRVNPPLTIPPSCRMSMLAILTALHRGGAASSLLEGRICDVCFDNEMPITYLKRDEEGETDAVGSQ
jgi:hypothetical protein